MKANYTGDTIEPEFDEVLCDELKKSLCLCSKVELEEEEGTLYED